MSLLAMLRGKPRITQEDYLRKLLEKGLNPDGTPILDSTPIAPPIGYKKTPSMVEIVRDMVRGEKLKAEAEAAGYGSFDEEDDFDIEDDTPQLRSTHEYPEDTPSARELLHAGAEEVRRRKAKKAPAKPSAEPQEPVPPSDGPDDPTDPE